jgi:integrase/recombinase XerD
MESLDKTAYVSYWMKRFLLEYMTSVRNQSNNTRKSYRDCFKLLLPHSSKYLKKSIDELLIDDIAPETIRAFLNYIENDRKCTAKTRNQRLAAINAFAYYVSVNSPERIEWNRLIHTIPVKKESVKVVNGCVTPRLFYLEKSEMDALLNAPDRKSVQGKRDYALLLFLYNSGARASEATSLTISNLRYANYHTDPQVIIYGKGNKRRTCPLWKGTMDVLKPFINDRAPEEHVFLNRYGEPITRYGVYEMVLRYAAIAAKTVPSILKKRVSPHTIRHSTASHLLEAGVDINTIRAWLGHVSVNTTNIYAEINIQMKANALKTCEIENKSKYQKSWKSSKKIMDFLVNL